VKEEIGENRRQRRYALEREIESDKDGNRKLFI
jgi:hypothetical protein